MSFVLDFSGRLDEAIRRAVHVELTRAVANLTLPPGRLHEGVHEARKSFKRLRAFYRLVAAADPQAAKREIDRFRNVAASLAQARDAAALVEAFDRLESAFPDEASTGILTPVRDFLIHRRTVTTHAASGVDAHVAAAVESCRAAYAAIDAFPLPAKQARVEKLLASGAASAVRKARSALKQARADGAAAAFHTLRKRVKDHLYHLGLLRFVWADQTRRAAIDALGERLGDLNDCDVLAAALRREAPALVAGPAGERALELIERQAEALRAATLAEAKRLLRKRPGAMRKALRRRLRRARER